MVSFQLLVGGSADFAARTVSLRAVGYPTGECALTETQWPS